MGSPPFFPSRTTTRAPWAGLVLLSSPCPAGALKCLIPGLDLTVPGVPGCPPFTVLPETLLLSPLWPAGQGPALTEVRAQVTQLQP